jgi:molecular chaperone DnaJ
VEVAVPARVDRKAKDALEALRDATSGDEVRAELMRAARKE